VRYGRSRHRALVCGTDRSRKPPAVLPANGAAVQLPRHDSYVTLTLNALHWNLGVRSPPTRQPPEIILEDGKIALQGYQVMRRAPVVLFFVSARAERVGPSILPSFSRPSLNLCIIDGDIYTATLHTTSLSNTTAVADSISAQVVLEHL
jgi:hypothetical protein